MSFHRLGDSVETRQPDPLYHDQQCSMHVRLRAKHDNMCWKSDGDACFVRAHELSFDTTRRNIIVLRSSDGRSGT